jgi:hypothetical protein
LVAHAKKKVSRERSRGPSKETRGCVRQLATDGTSAYWTASSPGDDFSDVVASPIAGGAARKIACHVSSIYAFAVDETDLYDSTWLAPGAPGKMIGRIPKGPN